jgi:hypothetical protein
MCFAIQSVQRETNQISVCFNRYITKTPDELKFLSRQQGEREAPLQHRKREYSFAFNGISDSAEMKFQDFVVLCKGNLHDMR